MAERLATRVCGSCGSDAPEGARFCPTCGAGLSVQTDERRIVTVVFADVVGFTALSEFRDPETVKNLIDGCFERLAADVTAHGGRVDKIVGDEIMAIFGAPTAHEDDAERAVRVGLQMQQTVADYAREVGSDLRVRIGVNTGEVLVGSLRAGGDVTAMGDVVNTANRLQSAAQPGQVVVGSQTFAATRSQIRYQSLGSLQTRGREGAVEAWEAVVPLGPPGSRPQRRRTPLVGRKAELGMLWHALSTAASHSRPHLMLLLGDAGVGKTRLTEEAIEIARSEHGALVLEGRCLPYGEANAWWPVAEALRQACEISPEDAADVAVEKCRRAVAQLVGTSDEGAEAARVADGLLYLMGYEASLHDVDPTRARDEALRAIKVSLGALARTRPLVIVLSEIHWADDLVLELVDSIFERLRNLPIMIIATARPELEDRWTPRPGRYNLILINLDPLDRESTQRLARELLGDALPRELLEELVERSGGNPLFLEELAALLGEAVPQGAGMQQLPATLRGLVAARLDALPADERAVLEDASVGGRRVPLEALCALGASREGEDARVLIDRLAEKDLVAVEGTEVEFKSELVRDVAYSTLTKAERARRHAALGRFVADHAAKTDREDEVVELVTYHLATAAEYVTELGTIPGVPDDIRDQALAWLERTVERASARETWGALLAQLDQALRLVGDEAGAPRRRFLRARARARSSLRDLDGARADALESIEEADAAEDPAARAAALNLLAEVDRMLGHHDDALQTLSEAMELWRELDDSRGEAEAVRIQGMTHFFAGRASDAESCFERARQLFQTTGDKRGEAWAVQHLAWVAFNAGDNDLAEQRLGEAEAMFVEVGDFGGQGWCLGLLGYVRYFKGKLDEAEVMAVGGMEWTRELGDRWANGMMVNLLAYVRLWQGRTRESLELAREAFRTFDEMGDDYGRLQALMALSWSLALTGEAEEAKETSRRAVETSVRVPSIGGMAVVHASHITSLLGEGARSLGALNRVADDWEDTPVLGEFDATRALALVLDGRIAEADTRMEALEEAKFQGGQTFATCIRALVRAAAGRPEDALADADALDAMEGGSYMDRLRGKLARILAYTRLGRADEAEAATAAALALLEASDDEVSRGLVRLAEALAAEKLLGEGSSDAVEGARRRLSDLGVTVESWERLMREAIEGGIGGGAGAPPAGGAGTAEAAGASSRTSRWER